MNKTRNDKELNGKKGGQYSLLSIAGLIISIIPLILYVFYQFENSDYDGLFILAFILMHILPVAGFILSIAGVVISKKKDKKGFGPGIAGIIISVIELVFVVISIYGRIYIAQHVKKPDKDYTITMHTSYVSEEQDGNKIST